VALDSTSESQLGRLTYAVELAASRSGRWEVKPLHDLVDPTSAEQRTKALHDAEAAAKLGQKAYDDLDAREAFQQFERAAHLYEQTDLSGKAFAGLINAWTMKIAALIATGNHRQGQAEIDKLLPVAPDAPLSATFFPPDDIAYGERVRSYIAKQKTSFSVSSSVRSSIIIVDGHYVGALPAQFEAASGEHFLTVVTPGFSLLQQRAGPGQFVYAPQSAALTHTFETVAKKIAASASGGPPAEAAVAEFGKLVHVNQILVVWVKTDAGGALNVTATRVDALDGHVWGQSTQAFDSERQLEQRVENWMYDLLGQDRPKISADRGTWNKRNTGYVVLGSAAALLAGGIFFGIQASNDSSTFRRLPQTDPNADALRSSGRTYAITADFMFLGALVTGVTGGYFAFFEPRSDPPAARN
jgi:hypothetical protein